MLIFSRKLEESIVINNNVKITIIDIGENRVKIGIEAPRDVPVHRTEIYNKIKDVKKSKYFTN
jgi:carbon storage regulator